MDWAGPGEGGWAFAHLGSEGYKGPGETEGAGFSNEREDFENVMRPRKPTTRTTILKPPRPRLPSCSSFHLPEKNPLHK